MEIIHSKIKKVKKNDYVKYIPVIEILNSEDVRQYQFGDIYFKDNEYWFLTFENHLNNFVSIKLFKISDIKHYYKNNKKIIEFATNEFIGNFFELNEDEQDDLLINKVFVTKNRVLQMIALESFEKELKEIILNVETILFYLHDKLELLCIEKLSEKYFTLNNDLSIHFSFNLNVSSNHPKKYCVPFNSYYIDDESKFYFYSNINAFGYIDFHYNNKVMDYNRFVQMLIEMKMIQYMSIKRNFYNENIFNKHINPLEFIYDYDKLEKLVKVNCFKGWR